MKPKMMAYLDKNIIQGPRSINLDIGGASKARCDKVRGVWGMPPGTFRALKCRKTILSSTIVVK